MSKYGFCRSNNLSLKYLRFTQSGLKYIGITKFAVKAKFFACFFNVCTTLSCTLVLAFFSVCCGVCYTPYSMHSTLYSVHYRL